MADNLMQTMLVLSAYYQGGFFSPEAHAEPSFGARLHHGKPLACNISANSSCYSESPLQVQTSCHFFYSPCFSWLGRKVPFRIVANADKRMFCEPERVSSFIDPGKVFVPHSISLHDTIYEMNGFHFLFHITSHFPSNPQKKYSLFYITIYFTLHCHQLHLQVLG